MEALEAWRRLDAELIRQRPAGITVGLERLRLAARAVEREHQLSSLALAERVLRDQRFELADDLGVAAKLEVGVDSVLDRRQPQLLEAPDLVLRKRLVLELGQGRPSPECECTTERVGTVFGRQRACVGDEPLEAGEVELRRIDGEEIPRRSRDDDVVTESLAEGGNGVLERGRGRGRRLLAPEVVHEAIGRDHPVRLQKEQRE
jgi:hypothetical protein